LCFVCFTIACLWGWYSGYIQRKYDILKENFHQFLADSGFVLDDILIDGRVRTPKTEIRNALNLPVDNLITTLDISAMQQNLQKLPWIKEASVTRQLPNILYLNLVERKPIALWQNGQKHYPIDEEGNIVTAHSLNDVPLLHIANEPVQLAEGGKLCDLAPTLLKLMNLEIPAEMSGKPLL
jgi:cell division septal protein FtsQ